jgi:muramidase (phage lysozyme)
MNRQNIFVATVAAIAAALLWPRNSQAATDSEDYPPPNDGYIPPDEPIYSIDPVVDMQGYSPNLRAFLYMIQRAEHSAGDVSSGAAYQTVFGGGRFGDSSDHPAITGEWRGKVLSDSMCRNAGFGPGCVSTAAGAYQIIKPTWARVKKSGSWGPALPDFGNASQDEAARRLLIERGALPFIERGEIENAISRAASEWASLPGNRAKQSQRSLPEVLAFYDDGLRIG